MRWQVQEAKQKFSEVLRHAIADGPQIVTRHGEEFAVVLDIREYRKLKGEEQDFKEYLLRGPESEEFAEIMEGIVGSRDFPGAPVWGDDE
ncbi:type II toxin-antitoxin system Phd/YefM family antitoxin [Streptomyces sp. NPDC002790]|uniref:type II toxin-antitoxin system Phd/YefM family antitoxin n=1 Tax=Streptomyces sp. NPDC002790 TaxID=3154431 RepID=UPI0033222123